MRPAHRATPGLHLASRVATLPPMSMTKDEVGAVLEAITQLLELKGENPFMRELLLLIMTALCLVALTYWVMIMPVTN